MASLHSIELDSGPDADVAIVGTGFAGICMALELKAAGFDSFVLLERGDDIGGTWRDNDYPGCACDIPSHLYSFSFKSARDWKRDFPTQPEILAYLHHVVERHDLRKHVRFSVLVTRASYDDATATWNVEMADGVRLRTRVLVSATGALSRPFVPALAGLDAFGGAVFHSARWNHACELAGKNVAVIGTGASAVQSVPRIAGEVANLYVFRRSAPWVLPKPEGALGPRRRKILRTLPFARWLYRQALYWLHEARALGFTAQPKLLRTVEKLASLYRKKRIRDPALRATLTHNSMIYTMESQVRYVVRALVVLRRRKLRALEVLPRVEARFNQRLQRRMAHTVWLSGCRSWYLDGHGKNTTLWPGFSFTYGLRTRRLRARRYRQLR